MLSTSTHSCVGADIVAPVQITIYIIYFLFRILDKIFAYDIMSLISE